MTEKRENILLISLSVALVMLSFIPHGRDDCLTGHNLDAAIAKKLNPDYDPTPTTKEGN